MAKTIADMLRKEGELRALRWILLAQLQEKFGPVNPPTRKTVKATTDLKQLRLWIKRLLFAQAPEDVQIGPPS